MPHIAEETFLHLFGKCPVANVWRKKWLEVNFGLLNLDENSAAWRKLWFMGNLTEGLRLNLFIWVAIISCQHTVWECKLSKKVPSWHTFLTLVDYKFGSIIQNKRNILKFLPDNNFAICRNLRAAAVPGGLPRGRW
jgi:hypothetical protein